MSKKNGGINDRPDESGEQSVVDGNSGISNTLDGEQLSDPPDQLTPEQARHIYDHAKTPTKRNSNVM